MITYWHRRSRQWRDEWTGIEVARPRMVRLPILLLAAPTVGILLALGLEAVGVTGMGAWVAGLAGGVALAWTLRLARYSLLGAQFLFAMGVNAALATFAHWSFASIAATLASGAWYVYHDLRRLESVQARRRREQEHLPREYRVRPLVAATPKDPKVVEAAANVAELEARVKDLELHAMALLPWVDYDDGTVLAIQDVPARLSRERALLDRERALADMLRATEKPMKVCKVCRGTGRCAACGQRAAAKPNTRPSTRTSVNDGWAGSEVAWQDVTSSAVPTYCEHRKQADRCSDCAARAADVRERMRDASAAQPAERYHGARTFWADYEMIRSADGRVFAVAHSAPTERTAPRTREVIGADLVTAHRQYTDGKMSESVWQSLRAELTAEYKRAGA